MARQVAAAVERILGHLAEHITRVEVHLSDENGKKGGSHDKRCMMEARLEGHQPIAVTHEAETIAQAIELAKAAGVDTISFWPTHNPFYGYSFRYALGRFNSIGVECWKGREVDLRTAAKLAVK